MARQPRGVGALWAAASQAPFLRQRGHRAAIKWSSLDGGIRHFPPNRGCRSSQRPDNAQRGSHTASADATAWHRRLHARSASSDRASRHRQTALNGSSPSRRTITDGGRGASVSASGPAEASSVSVSVLGPAEVSSVSVSVPGRRRSRLRA